MKVYFRVMRGGGSVYDRLIRWYTRSPYTHAEFCWPLDSPTPSNYLGAQTKDGVQVRSKDYLGNTPFDTFSVEVTSDQVNQMCVFLLEQVGKPYDFRAIAGMVFQRLDKGVKPEKAWFCSEILSYAFAKVGKPLLQIPLNQSDRITPRDVAMSPLATLVD